MKIQIIYLLITLSLTCGKLKEEKKLMIYYLPPMNTYYGDIDLKTFKGHRDIDSVELNRFDYDIIETKLLRSLQNEAIVHGYSFDTKIMIIININGAKKEIGIDLFNHIVYNNKVYYVNSNVLIILSKYIPSLNAFISE